MRHHHLVPDPHYECANLERRLEDIPSYRVWRAMENDCIPPELAGDFVRGYVVRFNEPSRGHFEWRDERLTPSPGLLRAGAFRRSLASGAPVRATINHDAIVEVGNTSDQSLRLWEDAHGLRFSLHLVDSSPAIALRKWLRTGAVRGLSFMFKPIRYDRRDELVVLTDVSLSEITFCVGQTPAFRSGYAELEADRVASVDTLRSRLRRLELDMKR